ncbi:hypothetical protein B0J12DRAFT_347296 [Macrophomina phaseolina]|uniref:Uncharacterized protein n=1 Tax=Macrophomina phaseolina TaxID=35725 RepID=A0ABQ8GMI7_9PEZI|nr:hypothetical protein B0J12DRAFT_347296 [Macrophomina phaseolina]
MGIVGRPDDVIAAIEWQAADRGRRLRLKEMGSIGRGMGEMESVRLGPQMMFPGKREAVRAPGKSEGPTDACGAENRLVISTLRLHRPCQLITHHKGHRRCGRRRRAGGGLPRSRGGAGRGAGGENGGPAQHPAAALDDGGRNTHCGRPPGGAGSGEQWACCEPIRGGAHVAQSGGRCVQTLRGGECSPSQARRARRQLSVGAARWQLCKEDVGDARGLDDVGGGGEYMHGRCSQALGRRTTHAQQLIAPFQARLRAPSKRSPEPFTAPHLARWPSTSQQEPPRLQRRDKLESVPRPLIRRRDAGA